MTAPISAGVRANKSARNVYSLYHIKLFDERDIACKHGV